PAIERWNRMREDVYKHSRFTPRTTVTRVAIYGLVLVLGAIYHLASQTQVRCHCIYFVFSSWSLKWSWAGKRKGEALARS
ncbi:hypothetical protein M405DRAFT_732613, partial [Rhizopogon salebrosus TDB-379]